jgi:hypothetical protein
MNEYLWENTEGLFILIKKVKTSIREANFLEE